MPMTMERLQELLRQQELKYFLDPDQPSVLIAVRGIHGTYRFVVSLQVEGRFLQFRSLEYLKCPGEHPHAAGVLGALGAVNYQRRLVKLGWDPSDGEVVVYADLWLEDATVTAQQFERMLQNFMSTMDLSYPRIRTALETGVDPGEEDPSESLGTAGDELPPELRALLEKGRKKGGEPTDDDDTDDDSDFTTI